MRDQSSTSLLATHDVSVPPVLRLSCARDGALLVWSGLYEMDRSDFPDLQMALVPRRGELTAPPVTVLERRAAEEDPAVASDGQSFVVAWRPRQENGARVDIVGTRVDARGQGLDRPARALGSLNAGHLSASWDGARYLLVGIQFLSVGNFELRGRRLSPGLDLLDADWFPIDKVSSRRGTGALPTTVGLGQGGVLVAYEAFTTDDSTGNQRLYTRRLTSPFSPDLAPDAGAGEGPAPAGARGGGCACAVDRRASPVALVWPASLFLPSLLLLGRRRRSGYILGRS